MNRFHLRWEKLLKYLWPLKKKKSTVLSLTCKYLHRNARFFHLCFLMFCFIPSVLQLKPTNFLHGNPLFVFSTALCFPKQASLSLITIIPRMSHFLHVHMSFGLTQYKTKSGIFYSFTFLLIS